MEWISVNDRLPMYDLRVLVYKKRHDKIEIASRTNTNGQGEHWSCDYQHNITHWSELPEPPKTN